MNSHLKLASRAVALILILATTTARAVPTLSSVEAGNVSTTSFYLCWETSESTTPGVDVFSDAEESQSLAGDVRIEFFPLGTDQRAVASTADGRAAGRALRDAMRAKKLVLVKLSGLLPDTAYYVRPTAVDGGGVPIATGPLQTVTTSQTVEFVAESRQVEIDLAALNAPGTPVAGTILSISTPDAAYPLFAVVGDSWSPTRAYADLTRFLDASGTRNLLPAGLMPLTITWKGLPETPGNFSGSEPDYDGSLLVAQVSRMAFDVTESNIDFLITLLKTPVVAGLPVNIAIEAQGSGGTPLLDYDRPASVTSPTLLATGEGITSPFIDGILASHTVTFSAPGQTSLTASDPLGDSESTTPVEVLPLTYDNWRIYYFGNSTDPAGAPDANPDGDRLHNKAEFAAMRNPLSVGLPVLGSQKSPGGLTVALDFNRLQSEYRVRFQTSTDLQSWSRSSIRPTLRESLADRDVIEAFFPAAEFNNQPFGAVRAVFELKPPPPVISNVKISGSIFSFDFSGDDALTGWKIMGSTDLRTYPYDLTPHSTITEPTPGRYQVEINLNTAPRAFFVRVVY